ncbi:MAG: hypothetical protein DRP85_08730, partial [Candidatus Makaraimicrobium thalassicum]
MTAGRFYIRRFAIKNRSFWNPTVLPTSDTANSWSEEEHADISRIRPAFLLTTDISDGFVLAIWKAVPSAETSDGYDKSYAIAIGDSSHIWSNYFNIRLNQTYNVWIASIQTESGFQSVSTTDPVGSSTISYSYPRYIIFGCRNTESGSEAFLLVGIYHDGQIQTHSATASWTSHLDIPDSADRFYIGYGPIYEAGSTNQTDSELSLSDWLSWWQQQLESGQGWFDALASKLTDYWRIDEAGQITQAYMPNIPDTGWSANSDNTFPQYNYLTYKHEYTDDSKVHACQGKVKLSVSDIISTADLLFRASDLDPPPGKFQLLELGYTDHSGTDHFIFWGFIDDIRYEGKFVRLKINDIMGLSKYNHILPWRIYPQSDSAAWARQVLMAAVPFLTPDIHYPTDSEGWGNSYTGLSGLGYDLLRAMLKNYGLIWSHNSSFPTLIDFYYKQSPNAGSPIAFTTDPSQTTGIKSILTKLETLHFAGQKSVLAVGKSQEQEVIETFTITDPNTWRTLSHFPISTIISAELCQTEDCPSDQDYCDCKPALDLCEIDYDTGRILFKQPGFWKIRYRYTRPTTALSADISWTARHGLFSFVITSPADSPTDLRSQADIRLQDLT